MMSQLMRETGHVIGMVPQLMREMGHVIGTVYGASIMVLQLIHMRSVKCIGIDTALIMKVPH